MIVTRTRVGDHICKMSELFYYFSNCWSEYHCTFSRDPLNMFSNDKTVKNTGHIVYCTDQTSREKAAEPVKIWNCDSNSMRRLQICIFAGSSFSMTGIYSDRAAQEYLIFLMMKRNIAGAVSSSTKVSGSAFMLCVCASWSEYIRFSQLAILQVKTSDFTNEHRQLGSDCARACSMINGKKNANYVRMRRFNFDSAGAGLSLSPLLS